MAHEEEKKPFVVKDRRRFDATGKPRAGEVEPEGRAPQARPGAPKDRGGPDRSASGGRASVQAERGEDEGPSISFGEFILSLATNAVMALGGDARDGRLPSRLNLPLAAQHIDILSMLAEKTHGNLTREEGELLESVLYDLRMKYVAVAQEQARGR